MPTKVKLLVCGSRGLLGQAVMQAALDHPAVTALGFDLEGLDICDRAAVERTLGEVEPTLVLNAAGYTDVDRAESEPEVALRANALGPAILARATALAGCPLLHLSTDHVFDGEATRPYTETDPPGPRGVYALSKLQGEEWVRQLQPRHYILRTAGMFGPGGRNFVDAIARRALAGQPLRVVADQVCARTYSRDLAAALLELATSSAAFGTYHVTNPGAGSWYSFAALIVERLGAPVPVEPVTTGDWNAPAWRPKYSVLALDRWAAAGLPPLRPVEAAVAEYLALWRREQAAAGSVGERS